MKKGVLNGGILVLVFVFLVLETFVSTFPQLAPPHPALQGKASQWLVWGMWGWLALNVLLSLWVGRKKPQQWTFTCTFSLDWALALLPLALGALVVMLTGKIRFGAMMGWLSLPWCALLVWQAIRRAKS